jgi:WD40 repeat protein
LDRPSIDEALFDARGSSVIAVAGNLVCQWVYDPLTKEFGAPVQQRYRVIRGAPLVLPHPRFPYVASAATDRVLVWTPYTPSGAGAPRSVEIPGAREAVTALAWAPWDGGGGGGRLALGDASGRVALFDIPPRGHEPASPLWEDAVLMAHEGAVTRLAFSPDGRWLASGSENCEVGVWAVDDRLPRWRPRSGRGRITDLSWSSDGTQLATAAADNRAVILDAATGSERRVFAGHPDWVVRVRFEDEDRRLVTFSFDGSARVYPVASQDASATVTLPDEVTSVEWAPQNDRLLVASRDGSVRLLSADGGDGSSSTMLDQQGLQGARFLPDGKRILLISGNRPWLRLVQANGDTVFSLPLPEGGALVTGSPREMIASTPSGSRILAIGPGGRPTLLTDGGTVLRALDYLIDPLYLMVVSRPGHEEFLAWSGRLPALLLDAEGEIRHTLRMPPEFRGIPAGATFSRDGRFVALTDSSMGVAVYDLLRPTAVSELPWLFHSPTPLACPPAWLQRENGLVLAPKHGPVQILDLGGSGASRKLDIEGARVSRMCSGRSGRPELILLMAQELVVWDLSADRMRMAVPLGSARLGDWDLAPDGERVALGFADGTLRIVDLDTLVQALQCRARPPLAAEMERYEFGTEAEKDLARRREDALTRRIGLDALRGRAISDPTDGHRLAYARRILDARDPAPERFEEAVLLCRRALALKTDPDPAFTELLARAERHCGRVDRAIAILRDALDRLAPTDPSRASLEDEFRVATAAGR